MNYLYDIGKVSDILRRANNWLFFFATTGAGYHSESKAKEYKHVCKRACQKVGTECI